MDVRMPGMDGIGATRRIVATGARTRMLILTSFDLDKYAYSGLHAGASGFLLKDARSEEFLAGIEAVATDDAVVSPQLTRRLLDAHAHDVLAPSTPTHSDPRVEALSDRDRIQAVIVAYDAGLVTPRQ